MRRAVFHSGSRRLRLVLFMAAFISKTGLERRGKKETGRKFSGAQAVKRPQPESLFGAVVFTANGCYQERAAKLSARRQRRHRLL